MRFKVANVQKNSGELTSYTLSCVIARSRFSDRNWVWVTEYEGWTDPTCRADGTQLVSKNHSSWIPPQARSQP